MGTLFYILQFFCTDSHRCTLLRCTLLRISSTAHTATADRNKQTLVLNSVHFYAPDDGQNATPFCHAPVIQY